MMRILAALLFVWAGLLLGVSFVATPAKFLAPSLPLTQALDVGRWTFYVLAWIEWGFAVATALLIVAACRASSAGIGLVAGLVVVVAAALAVETFVLRPLLDERVLRIMAGKTVPPDSWHAVYIALEALRLALIFAAGVIAMRIIPGTTAVPRAGGEATYEDR
ncbi:MAG: hypothetical protein AB7O43_00315 [Hyphomicrobiaceae bacterium]